jgi:hypothetical protein
MFERPEALDKRLSEITEQEQKQISRWSTIRNIYPFALLALAVVSGMFLSRLIPTNWGKLARVVAWVLMAFILIRIADFIRNNINYAQRKKRQARKIMQEPEKIIHQLRS